jgi:hypothetical protein
VFTGPSASKPRPGKRGVLPMNLLDIVTAMNRELRFNSSFRALLRDCDNDSERRITQAYLEWINQILEAEEKRSSKPR